MTPNKGKRLDHLARNPDAGQPAVPAKRLLASWQRSEEYGVSPEERKPHGQPTGSQPRRTRSPNGPQPPCRKKPA